MPAVSCIALPALGPLLGAAATMPAFPTLPPAPPTAATGLAVAPACIAPAEVGAVALAGGLSSACVRGHPRLRALEAHGRGRWLRAAGQLGAHRGAERAAAKEA